ncbi:MULTISPECIES: hypothetical protein [Klebsiella]|uniref:Uncharacterized protein n=2 Tax=Klebsiella pneumoniae TaxID=573 RepID=A0A6A8EQ76_KLEPN|nr:hypothetical protein [Klebsiella pneumoniae]EIX9110111.1 hypothetical protein [Klebsiella pneumoniae]EKV7608816.1 hypothetical protein [Klebsiella pneumoniae]EKZ6751998.1 hypothetical protein [Klebsiella pneumoniae]ELZ7173765.1 hypothetical protein [Klebsiella pneumoniae]MBC4121067.1 hypothetical protein [Klebsiella pneumoniae]
MQYSLLLSLCTLLYTAISIAERPKIAENDFFTISVSCNGQRECIYNGQSEIPVVVSLRNIYSKGFYISLGYIKKTEPSVKLTDRDNKKIMLLKPNLVSWDLKKRIVYIPERKNVEFTWALLDRDISPFINDGAINVDADFKIRTKIYDIEENEMGEFISLSKIIIKGSDFNENKR